MTADEIDRLSGNQLGVVDVACPECGPARREKHNRTRKVLRIWRHDPSFATYYCARCGLRGWAGNKVRRLPVRPGTTVNVPDAHAMRQAEKALALWRRRRPAEGTPVERYLRGARGFYGPVPATIGYLPAVKPEHHPAMIATFGFATELEPGVVDMAGRLVRGIHLTLLTPDGSRKADASPNKLMVGPSSGCPIVVAPFNDLLGLIVCEGIETGCVSAWNKDPVSGVIGIQKGPL